MSYSFRVAIVIIFSTLAGCSVPPQQCMTFRTVKEEGANTGMAFVRYLITTQEGETYRGVTNKDGFTSTVSTRFPDDVKIEFPQSVSKTSARSIPSSKVQLGPTPGHGKCT
ncbi:hypothetical protein ABQX22_08070 [Xanthomonas sp. WHRI 1810A]|uniref:hypothetical protein n=1 Tax=Xanthomonas sp. WHRI 1810A TaxID=3161565 RepID=UPI0032E9350D